jgi:hypothetical protein
METNKVIKLGEKEGVEISFDAERVALMKELISATGSKEMMNAFEVAIELASSQEPCSIRLGRAMIVIIQAELFDCESAKYDMDLSIMEAGGKIMESIFSILEKMESFSP